MLPHIICNTRETKGPRPFINGQSFFSKHFLKQTSSDAACEIHLEKPLLCLCIAKCIICIFIGCCGNMRDGKTIAINFDRMFQSHNFYFTLILRQSAIFHMLTKKQQAADKHQRSENESYS